MLKVANSVINASQITGVLPVVNGGTGVTTSTGTGNTVLSASPTLSGDVTLSTGNLVIGTDGKGIDFSATPGTGTSELLNDYEEGTWTPVGNGITYSTAIGTYTKIGRFVYLSFNITFPATANANAATMSGIPFANGTNSAGGGGYRYSTAGQYFSMAAGSSDVSFFDFTGNQPTNASLSTKQIQGFVEYTV